MILFLPLWSLLWTLGLPAVLLYLRRRARKDALYGQHLAERFGAYRQSMQDCVWIHAVSLGEMRSAVPLVRALLDRGERVVCTHFTPAGRREAERIFPAEISSGRLAAVWVPFEFAFAYRRFFRTFQPKLGLVMEIEIWPRMVFAARRAGVPLFMCNAQYPTKSIVRDRKFPLRSKVMRGFGGALVKSQLQADRFAAVGVKNIHVTGELRFDQPIPPAQIAAGQAARETLAKGRRVVTFASVVQGEDAIYLDVVKTALSEALTVYVPRKPERFEETAGLLQDAGLAASRRSAMFDEKLSLAKDLPVDVLLGDSLGEMYFYLTMADLAVTGGGFTPHGAHNIIEPLSLGIPVIVGPEIHTIEYPAVEAIAAGVCCHAKTPEDLAKALANWPGPTRQQIRAFLAEHSGATAKTLAALEPWLTRR